MVASPIKNPLGISRRFSDSSKYCFSLILNENYQEPIYHKREISILDRFTWQEVFEGKTREEMIVLNAHNIREKLLEKDISLSDVKIENGAYLFWYPYNGNKYHKFNAHKLDVDELDLFNHALNDNILSSS